MTEPKKIMLDRGKMFCYVASVDGERRLNMSLHTSMHMDRVARAMDLSVDEMLFMQLKMRAVRISDAHPNAHNGLQLVVEDVRNIAIRDTMMGLREEEESKALGGLDLNFPEASGSGVASDVGVVPVYDVQALGSEVQASESDVQASGSDEGVAGSDVGASGSEVGVTGFGVKNSGTDVKTSTLL